LNLCPKNNLSILYLARPIRLSGHTRLPTVGYANGDSLLEVAIVNMEFNVSRKWRKMAPELQDNIRDLVC
jgi:hypothetical protein